MTASLTHALSTDTEEIMGLLLGDVKACNSTCNVAAQTRDRFGSGVQT
jgi:hypothetical protein